MPGQAAKVVITEKQQVILREFASSRGVAAATSQRAKIILLAFEKTFNEEIAEQVGLNRNQVGIWRKRWQAAWPELTNYECAEEPSKLREAIRALLRDAPRAGSPGKFTAEQLTQVLAVACESPQLSGRPITHWTLLELQAEVVKRGIVASISDSYLSVLLRSASLQPQKKRCGSTPPRKIRQCSSDKCGRFAKPINKLTNVMHKTAREPFASTK